MEDRVRYTSVPPQNHPGNGDNLVNPTYSSTNISTASESVSVTVRDSKLSMKIIDDSSWNKWADRGYWTRSVYQENTIGAKANQVTVLSTKEKNNYIFTECSSSLFSDLLLLFSYWMWYSSPFGHHQHLLKQRLSISRRSQMTAELLELQDERIGEWNGCLFWDSSHNYRRSSNRNHSGVWSEHGKDR